MRLSWIVWSAPFRIMYVSERFMPLWLYHKLHQIWYYSSISPCIEVVWSMPACTNYFLIWFSSFFFLFHSLSLMRLTLTRKNTLNLLFILSHLDFDVCWTRRQFSHSVYTTALDRADFDDYSRSVHDVECIKVVLHAIIKRRICNYQSCLCEQLSKWIARAKNLPPPPADVREP